MVADPMHPLWPVQLRTPLKVVVRNSIRKREPDPKVVEELQALRVYLCAAYWGWKSLEH